MRKMYGKEVQAVGHLIDSGIMSQIFDTIIKHRGQFKVNEFVVGRTNIEPSTTRLTVTAETEGQLDRIMSELNLLGCTPVEIKEAVLKPAEHDKVVSRDFYSTTNHKTEIYYKGKWLLVENQRMDAMIVVDNGKAFCKKTEGCQKRRYGSMRT